MHDAPAPGPDLTDDAEAKAAAEALPSPAPEATAVPAPAGPVAPAASGAPAAPAVPAQARPEQRTDVLPPAASAASTASATSAATSGAAPGGTPRTPGARLAPVLLVCGVSGSGKTTIGALLAERLGWVYAEADAFHPPANVAKMAAGHPLDDADRVPWLAAIGAYIDETTLAGRPAVVTCSALKRAYRDELRRGRPNVRVIFLEASYELIRGRLQARAGHFFPAELLASQFRDLEPPEPDENILQIAVDDGAEQVVERLLSVGVGVGVGAQTGTGASTTGLVS